MLTICTWWWGEKYPPQFVEKVAAGLKRHVRQDYQFICFTETSLTKWTQIRTERIEDRDLLKVHGCFARLRLFDPEWQEQLGIRPGGRVVCIDLDVVITGNLDPLFDRVDNFTILTGANSSNPCPYNGSIWMLRAGYRPDVWSDFSLDAAKAVPFFEFPDDQAWFAHKMPGLVGWKVGPPSRIYAFQKPAWPPGNHLPKDARLVVFPGWRSPEKFTHLPWVREHWR